MAEDVLIIEAEDEVARALSQSLAERSWPSRTTPDGKEGLDLAQHSRPAAIILCAELPKMSGYSICAKLKKDPNLRDIPLIFTSSEASESTFEHHKKLKVRANDYINKPFDMGHMMELLGRHIPLDSPAVTEEEAVDLGDLGVDADDPDPFDVEQAISGAAASLDSALQEIAEPEPLPEPAGAPDSIDLSGSVGVSARADNDDEALTTVGAPPEQMDPSDALRQRIQELEKRLHEESQARQRAERLSEERAQTASQLPSASQPPSSAARELYNLKKELNHKDHEILELRDKLHTKDKEMLNLRDREMELEGRIVQAEEERDQEKVQKTETEQRLRAAQEERDSAQAKTDELSERLQQSEHQLQGLREEQGRLESELHSLREDKNRLERAKSDLEQTERQLEREKETLNQQVLGLSQQVNELESERDQLGSAKSSLEHRLSELEQTREELERGLADQRDRGEELERARKELDERVQSQSEALRKSEDALDQLRSEHEAAAADLSRMQQEADDLRQRLQSTEQRADHEGKRRHETEAVARKARQAIEIAVKMLNEVDVDDNNGASEKPLYP